MDECRVHPQPARPRSSTAQVRSRWTFFHQQFLLCCPNAYLRSSYELIWFQLIALRLRSPIENCVDSHKILIDAIERGEVDGACKLLEGHVFENEERYCIACGVA